MARARVIRIGPMAAGLLLGAGGLSLPLAGCYERTVEWNPPLANLPGAKTGMPTRGERLESYVDPTQLEDQELREETEDGETVLRARSGRHLMVHIFTTLRDGERELFTDQVLSELTKAEFRENDRDPGEAFDMLKKRQEDVKALFDMMPQGESTPGVHWENLGRHGPNNDQVVRLRVTGLGTRDLHWNFLDMVRERGNWRLRWFGRK